MLAPASAAEPRASSAASSGPADSSLNLLLVDVTLAGDPLADLINVYGSGDDILLPVGELARLLTLGVTVDPVTHVASGFILKEDRTFRLDPAAGEVTVPGSKEPFDHGSVRWIEGDLYASLRQLQRWWPVDLNVNMGNLSLEISPREKLPVQLRIEREKAAALLRGTSDVYQNPGYPRLGNDYRLFSLPFIDNTLGISINRSGRKVTSDVNYSGYATGDLLGMEAESFLSVSKSDRTPKARLTLSRHEPDGGLLGPLDAKLFAIGNIGLPSLENVLRGGGVGNGLVVSNRPLDQPTSYGMQSLRGDLPQGWDVTLYFNDAIIAFAQSRNDGLYEFNDLPLAFGRNEFRLVFHGPLGQTRIERHAYQLDQALTKPGRLYYTFAGQRDSERGSVRQTAHVDFGLFKNAAATLGEVYIDQRDGTAAHSYIHAGLRAAALGSLIKFDHSRDLRGGSLTEVGLLTKLFGVSVDADRLWLDGFQSDSFAATNDPLRSRDRLRLVGGLSLGGRKLPFGIDVTRTRTASGIKTIDVNQRLSLNLAGTSLTNTLEWSRAGGNDSVNGALQINRFVAGTGLNGQITYTIVPQRRLTSLALTADKSLNDNDRFRIGVLHDFLTRNNIVTAGVNRNFGNFGAGFSALYGGPHTIGLGLQLFTALGRDPRSGRIVQDWRPTAGIGQVSAHVFVDGNQNGTYDSGEENVENAGFTVNGGNRQQAKTDAKGLVLLNRLQAQTYADIALDQGTLEDPQWLPEKPGMRVLPRPGRVRVVDLPVVLTAEIDGIVYLSENGAKRGIGNARLELVDAAGKVVGTSRSASDGYYIIPSVRPGAYRLRLAPEQLTGLKLVADREADVTIDAKADFVNGIDFTIASQASANSSSPRVSETGGDGVDR